MQLPWSKNAKLLKAVKSEDLEKVQLLLKSGADPNTKDMVGRYVLVFAAAKNNVKIVKSLLDAGADPNVKSINNTAPLSVTINPEIIKYLLEKGADPEIYNNDGWTPIMIAASDGDVEVVKILIKAKVNLNTKDLLGRIALGMAVHHKHRDVVKILLEAGADPNITSRNNTSILMMAAVDGDMEMVKLLINFGADPKIKDVDGNTAITVARDMGHTNIVELLSKEKVSIGRKKTPSEKIQILCLDDSHSLLDSYQQILQECGYTTYAVTDSSEALSILRKNKIDLLIQDFNHPRGNGAELLKIVKLDDDLKNIPVVMITGMTRDSIVGKLQIYDLDIDRDLAGFIHKPFKVKQLQETVENVINNYNSAKMDSLSPAEIFKRTKDVPDILKWSRNKHLLISGPNFWGIHHVFIDNSLKHCFFMLKMDSTTHVFIGDPIKAKEWRKYDENFALVLSKQLEKSTLEWKIYKDCVLYRGTMLPPKEIAGEPYWGRVTNVEEFANQIINDQWIIEKLRELHS